ncbi:sigma-70 family RNA polymerase sigma factor [Rhabdothermincola sediminis]|uniref:sigma-70 family RNA polymerase sigma factor n=1 Tax=Rhabdothermincola sediminis TaxID=2751370 RepID=UPI001AA01AC7|nr:sigma-70 family RNA polymerase sigma factor [Rhabdothermincola sediminis]
MDHDLVHASDAALIVGVGRWRQDALAEVYRRHAGSVLALARRLLASREEAEEVVQEVFLRLWNQPERFEPARGSLRSYLLAQTHGRAIDRLRSDTARRAREERDARRTATGAYDLEHEVADLVVAEQVRAALAVLSDDEREIVQLAYFGGHTYAEVATMLRTPAGTVKGRMRSALTKLRRELLTTGLVRP